MFKVIFFYRLKSMLKMKERVFLTGLLPIFIITLFYASFGTAVSEEKFVQIPVGIVSEKEEQISRRLTNQLSMPETEDAEAVFAFTFYEEEEKAKEDLKREEIKGYIKYEKNSSAVNAAEAFEIDLEYQKENDLVFVAKKNGYAQSIIKIFLEEYEQTGNILDSEEFLMKSTIKQRVSDASLYSMYILLGMVCLSASFAGVLEVKVFHAEQSSLGQRQCTTPVKRSVLLLSSLCATLLMQFGITTVAYLYMNMILDIRFAKETGGIVFVYILGTSIGVLAGMLLGSTRRVREITKISILLGAILFAVYASGMFHLPLNYEIQKNYPIASRLNICNLIADSYYTLYFFASKDQFRENVLMLSIIAILLFFAVCVVFRRRRYERL